MTRPIRLDNAASAELYDAVRWYEAQRPGLGADLLDAVVDAVHFIEGSPEAGAAISPDTRTRRVLVEKFPYHLIYRVRPDEIVVVAVAHLKRRPGYWRHRE